MILDYRKDATSVDEKVQSLMESVQLALNEKADVDALSKSLLALTNELNKSIAQLNKTLSDMQKVESITLPWNEGTEGSALTAVKVGNIVTVYISNPTKLNTQNNIVATLPQGWRPAINATCMLIAPVGSVAAGGTYLSLRAFVKTNGEIEIYNYRSTAISGNTNQSGTITFVAK